MKNIFDYFDKIFSDELAKNDNALSDSDLHEEIVGNYFILLKELGIENFSEFRFAGYDYCREIIVDGKEYDLDCEFCHDDAIATESLCAIDCLIADISEDEEEILKNIEKMINAKSTDK